MAATEIHLNKRGINSVELPAQVDVEAGKSLFLSFNNHGHPLHVSLSAINAARYTPFTHENLFIQGQTDFEIPMLEDAGEGAFTLEVVTGYGRTSCEMRVFVRKPRPETPAEKPAEMPARRKIPWLRAGPILLGLLLYGASFLWPDTGLKDLAFLVLLAALLIPWLRQA